MGYFHFAVDMGLFRVAKQKCGLLPQPQQTHKWFSDGDFQTLTDEVQRHPSKLQNYISLCQRGIKLGLRQHQ